LTIEFAKVFNFLNKYLKKKEKKGGGGGGEEERGRERRRERDKVNE